MCANCNCSNDIVVGFAITEEFKNKALDLLESGMLEDGGIENIENLYPMFHTDGASGFDLRSTERYVLMPNETVKLKTGLRFRIPDGYEIQVRPRSGLSTRGIIVILGTVDSDYSGEVSVTLYNRGLNLYVIDSMSRIAQAVVQKVPKIVLEKISEKDLKVTGRGNNGFGHTGSF